MRFISGQFSPGQLSMIAPGGRVMAAVAALMALVALALALAGAPALAATPGSATSGAVSSATPGVAATAPAPVVMAQTSRARTKARRAKASAPRAPAAPVVPGPTADSGYLYGAPPVAAGTQGGTQQTMAQPVPAGYATVTTPSAGEYILSPNDRVRITVFGEPNLSGEFTVDAQGNVSMPLIGEVRAAGIDLRLFQRNLESRLARGYLVDPRVSAEILNFRPFYVLGEVKTPGEYPFANGLTLLNAIAQAGGFTPLANLQELRIRRANAQGEVPVAIQAGFPVMPGDTIRVEKASVFIFGEVQRPGEYPIPPGLNVVTAVAQAGGYTNLADTTTVNVKRSGSNVETPTPAATGQLVRPGDTLRVGKSSFFILGEVNRPGEYPLTQALTVMNAAALAGGYTYRADQRRIFIRRAGELEEKPYRSGNDLQVRQGDTIRVAERFF
jgi:protein involved in polysaccharide export with SLBB domain